MHLDRITLVMTIFVSHNPSVSLSILSHNSSELYYNRNFHRQGHGIIFIKTHKTASTTMTSILQRYCVYSHMKCFIPPPHVAGRTWRLWQRGDWMDITKGKSLYNGTLPYHDWLYHTSYHLRLFSLVPSAKGKVLTIVRHPADRFRSAWAWYEHWNKYSHKTHSSRLGISLNKYTSMIARHPSSSKSHHIPLLHRGLNAMTEELVGLPCCNEKFVRQFENLLHGIYSWKWMVLIAERFNESLLILSQSYNIPLRKLLYRRHKVNKQWNNPETSLDESGREILAKAQPFDLLLYNVASYMLDESIGRYNSSSSSSSSSFLIDLDYLEKSIDNLHGLCFPCWQIWDIYKDIRMSTMRDGRHVKLDDLRRIPCYPNLKYVVTENSSLTSGNDVMLFCFYYFLDNFEFVEQAWSFNLNPPDIPNIALKTP
eukprot:gene160-271_t